MIGSGNIGCAIRSRVLGLRESETTRAGVVNGLCGVADYLVQPVGMLLAAPFLLHRLGLAQYGLWMIASAAIGSSGLLSTGFSDMAIKYVAMYRGRNDWAAVVRVIQSSMAINLTLGSFIAIVLWVAAPLAAAHVFNIQTAIQPIFIQSIRLGSVALLVRSLDSIFVSVLRAYEKYRPAVQIAVLSRSLVIVAAVVLVARGSGVVSIMVATVAVNTAGMILQGLAVRSHVGRISLLPSWNHELLPTISSFGCFSWLQALSGIVFGQADRLIVGALLGTSAVAYYSICTQAAQPIHGIIASALHFLFPHLSAKHSTSPITELRPIVTMAFLVNLGLVAFLCLPMVFLSKLILTVWMGATFASRGAPILSLTAIGFGLVGINVTGHYVLMAVGAIRYVTLLNLAAGLAMICAIVALILPFGLMGAAAGRLVYGPVTWLMYLKIYSMLKSPSLNSAIGERLAEFSEEVC